MGATDAARLHRAATKLGLLLFLTNEALAFMQGVVKGSIRLYDLNQRDINDYLLVTDTVKIVTSKYDSFYVCGLILEVCALIAAVVSTVTLRSKRTPLHFSTSVLAGPLLATAKALYIIYQSYVGKALAELSFASDVMQNYSYVEQRFVRAAGFWASPTYAAIAAAVGLAAVASLLVATVTVWKYEIVPEMPSPVAPPSLVPVSRDTKFCRMCGAKIPSDSRFCEFCGSRTTIQQETENRSNMVTPPEVNQLEGNRLVRRDRLMRVMWDRLKRVIAFPLILSGLGMTIGPGWLVLAAIVVALGIFIYAFGSALVDELERRGR